jgi:DNA repair protein RadA/Sms
MTTNIYEAGDRMVINSLKKKLDPCTNILDVNVPGELEKEITCGVPFLDDGMGGRGFTPSTAALFTGTSGAGKTTLMIQMADAITGKGNICLFNTCEESVIQIRKVTKRLKIQNGFYVGQDHKVPKIIDHCRMLIEQNPGKQLFLVCDSLQTLDDCYYDNGYTNSMSAVRCTTMLTDFAKIKCKKVYPIVILIGQVSKSGDFSGRNAIKHAVDVHMHLSIDQDKKSDTYGLRILEVNKNRFGGAGRCYVLDMQSEGLSEMGSFDKVDRT